MALKMWGHVIIQDDTPGEDPVVEGTLWIDTSGTATLKVCTSISPYTFAAITGSSGALNDLSDVVITSADSGDYLRFNGTNWVDVAIAQLATDLAASFAALAHATRHKSGGADAIKLDELAAPDDNTTLNASTTAHGLSPKATAPAAGLLSVLGIGNGETVRADKPLFDTTNPAPLGAAGPGTQLVAARRDHIHANPAIDTLAAATDITTLDASTSAHGLLVKAVAPAAGIQAVPAIRNGETAYVVRDLFDDTNPAALGTAAPGTSLIAARRDHVHEAPAGVEQTEGTWTPTMAFGGSATGITYTTQLGYYIKTGKDVLIFGRVVLTSNGTGTGIPTLTDLPFTVENLTSGRPVGACLGQAGMSGNFFGLVLRGLPNTTTAEFIAMGTNVEVPLGAGNLLDNTAVDFTLHYKASA